MPPVAAPAASRSLPQYLSSCTANVYAPGLLNVNPLKKNLAPSPAFAPLTTALSASCGMTMLPSLTAFCVASSAALSLKPNVSPSAISRPVSTLVP